MFSTLYYSAIRIKSRPIRTLTNLYVPVAFSLQRNKSAFKFVNNCFFFNVILLQFCSGLGFFYLQIHCVCSSKDEWTSGPRQSVLSSLCSGCALSHAAAVMDVSFLQLLRLTEVSVTRGNTSPFIKEQSGSASMFHLFYFALFFFFFFFC